MPALIEVSFSWTDVEPKGKPFTITNGGDDEARNIQVEPLTIGKHRFTFDRIAQLLPGRSATRLPQPGEDVGFIFDTIIDVLEIAIDERGRELAAEPRYRTANAFEIGQAARDEFEHIPLTVTFEDRGGRKAVLEYRLVSYVFAHMQSAGLQFVFEVEMSSKPNPLPPLRVSAEEALNSIRAKREEGAHLFDGRNRFTHEMQDRFFEWIKSTGAELERLYWAAEVSKWFHTGTMWIVGDFRGTIETRDDRLNVLDELIASIEQAPARPAEPARDFEYDVCLSFAGEQRDYVEAVYKALTSRGVKVFYDKAEQAKLWGKDLYQHLNDVYRDKAKFCVMFISKEYSQKRWTSHERQGAQARAFRENSEYILPVRFDSTDISGLNETVGYVNAREYGPDQLADLIMEKLASCLLHYAGDDGSR